MTRRLLSVSLLSGILVVLMASAGAFAHRIAEAAGPPALVTVIPSTSNAACGVPVSVQVQVVDSLGAPVPGVQGVTLTSTFGTITPSLTGTTNGIANVTLNTVAGLTGTAVITASSSGFQGQATVNVTCGGFGGYGGYCGYTLCQQPCTVYGCYNNNNNCYYAYNCYAPYTTGNNCGMVYGSYYNSVCYGNCSYYNIQACPMNCGGLSSCAPSGCGGYYAYAGYSCGGCYAGYYYGGCQQQLYSAPPVSLPPIAVAAQQANYSQPTYTAPTTQQATYTPPSSQPTYTAPAQQDQYYAPQPQQAPQQQAAAQGRPFFPPNTGSGGMKGVATSSTSTTTLPFFGIVGLVFAIGVVRLRRSSSASR